MAVIAYIGLGSNVGDRIATMRRAVGLLAEQPDVIVRSASPVYESEPTGPVRDQPFFLNGVVQVETRLSAEELHSCMRTIEADLGRVRREPGGPRTIDLDLLLYGDSVLDAPHLTVPHPAMRERAFVLMPLLDVAPGLLDPRDARPLASAAEALPPSQCQRRGHLSLVVL